MPPIAFPPAGLNRSGVACWFSIKGLIESAHACGIPCYLWTLTFADVVPDSWAGNMHSRLVAYMRNSVRDGHIPEFAGVRVVEEHPGGHGLHYHWVLRGKVSLAVVRSNAKRAGFGHVFIARDSNRRFRKVDVGAAGYLAKYLTKNEKLHGVRSWACIGTYEGSKTRDIEFASKSVDVFRTAYAEAKFNGLPRASCFNAGIIAQRRHDACDDTGGDGCFRPRSDATGRPAGLHGDESAGVLQGPPCEGGDVDRAGPSAIETGDAFYPFG